MVEKQSARRTEGKEGKQFFKRWYVTAMQARLMVVSVLAVAVSGLLAVFIASLLSRFGILPGLFESPFRPFVIVFVGAIIGIVVSFILIAFFMRPIKEFIQATERVRAGDYTVRVTELGNRSELFDLQRSFNQMAEELQSTEIFSNDFINDFSHEFKTPIVNIHGFAGELLKGDISEEQQQEYLRIIYDESQRLADLSSNVLLLSKVESLQLLSKVEPIDLAEGIRRSILFLQNKWEAKDLTVEPLLCEVTIMGNPELLFIVWQNLLGNAIKFSPQGGRIAVSSSLHGDTVEVSFSDEGPGMDEETAGRVFEKFFQGDASRASQGNGIGLSLVKRVVELHGGKVELDTAPEAGAVFTVILPVG